jgi:4-carboxymuconolactone decarboxylase
MTKKIPVLVAAVGLSLTAQGQSRLPADINPETLSRLPPVERSQLDDEGKRIWDFVTNNGTVPMSAPPRVAMYSPKAAELNNTLNRHLRATVNGVRYFELSTLIAAREFDQQYEWSAHEPTGLQAGLPQSVIDVVKYNRDVAGLPEKDATVIRLGRAIFRDHRVSPELWAKTVQLFGQRGAVEVVLTLGEYAMTAVMLTAVDQQLPPDRKPLLPARK